MESTCTSFYDKEPIKTITPVIETPVAAQVSKATPAKKKSILWIWAASAFAALLLSPDENVNNIDKPATP